MKMNILKAITLGLLTNLSFASTDLGVQWKTGQVIGVSEMKSDPSTFIFEVGTASRYGHVGIVVVEGKDAFVYEATPPMVQKTRIEDFMERVNKNSAGKYEATLVDSTVPLSLEEQKLLVSSMEDKVRASIPYNYSMVLNAESMNCSEFVYKMFATIKRNVGEIEKYSGMNTQALNGKLVGFLAPQGMTADSKVVTPISVMSSPSMKVLVANLPVNKLLSDADIVSAWNKNNGFEGLKALFDLSESSLRDLIAAPSTKPYRNYPTNWRK